MGSHTDLEDGWRASTPLGDTLLRRYVLNLAASFEAPVVAMGGRIIRGDGFVAADLGRPAGYANSCVLVRPPADDALDEIDAFFGSGAGTVELWSAWPTPDLRARGWELEGHPPLLIRPAGVPLPDRPTPGDLRVEPVTSRSAVRDWERVAVDGFPLPEVQPLKPGALVDERVLSDERIRMWVGYAAGRPVVIGSLFVDSCIGNLTLGATLPHARRRGYWAAMALTRLRAIPDLPAAALFSDMSRPGAEALGFLPITRFTLWRKPRP